MELVKGEVKQNCSKCSKSTDKPFKCVECHKVFCKNEVGDKVKIGKGYQLETERCKECKLKEIKGFEGIKEAVIEKQKPIILMDEYERKKESEKKPCITPCPVHCKNRDGK